MKSRQNNFAYIDGANLHKGIMALGWKLDYRRFRVWLTEKYGVSIVYLFIGLIPKNKSLYTFLQEAGYVLVFKETTYDNDGNPKGNCDADLVLRATRDFYENNFNQTVIVTSDGDYASLVQFLDEKKKLFAILSPALPQKCSILLKRLNVPITYLHHMRSRLEQKKEKAPATDGTV